jgi:acetoin utilization deacetylase AcuC-like enzyme
MQKDKDEYDIGKKTIADLMSLINDKIKNKQRINLVAYVDDNACDKHHSIDQDNKDVPNRIKEIRTALNKYAVNKLIKQTGSISVRKSDLTTVHCEEYIDTLFTCARQNKPVTIPLPSTGISMKDISSLESILASPASVMGAIDSICGKMKVKDEKKIYNSRYIKKVFCLVRPPGNQAFRDRGFKNCFVNNIAIGVKFAMNKYEDMIHKVLIFDWSLERGDGIIDIIKNDNNIMYASFHKDNGTIVTENLNDNANANILCYPITSQDTSETYINKFKNEFLPQAYNFKPDIVIISAGFDSHKDDSKESLSQVDFDTYITLTNELSKLANVCSDSRLVSVLEGGYNQEILHKSAITHILAMITC